jgi:hypothetical protein
MNRRDFSAGALATLVERLWRLCRYFYTQLRTFEKEGDILRGFGKFTQYFPVIGRNRSLAE